jgi:cbb3-type cytochrome oxidase subunit 3
MFKEVFKLESVMQLSSWALLIFMLVFIGMTIWTWTRSRKTIDRWASLPLNDSYTPTEELNRNRK